MGPRRWFVAVSVVLATVVIGVFAYQAGLAQGAASAAAAAGTLPPYAYAWGWHRPWGFGFGFPMLFILFFWFVLLRGLFWGPWHRRRWYYYGDVPRTFDDWHRRAHERMSADAPKS